MQKVKLKVAVALILVVALCIGIVPTLSQGQLAYAAYTTDAVTYYNGITAESGQELLGQLHDLIVTTHKYYTSYNDVKTYSKNSDPGSGNNTVLEFYTHSDINNDNWDVSGGWNREHVWAQDLSKENGNGTQLWGKSGGGSDLHHVRPSEKDINNHRGNKKYGEVTNGHAEYTSVSNILGGHSDSNTFEPLDNVKGDVARIVLYVYTHYNKASNVGGTSDEGNKTYGNLPITNVITASNEKAAFDMLVQWNANDPVDEIERTRNNYVASLQGNRNPFIDHPEYVNAIWSDTPWQEIELTSISVSPNTAQVAVGATTTLNVVKTPSNAAATITWSSSNPSVATVSATGVVTGVQAGTATITATPDKQGVAPATATVTVKQITGITVTGTPTKTTYNAGQKFDPTGLTVKANFSDSTEVPIALTDCQWLDGTTGNETLSVGTTTVTCKYGATHTQTISGITVEEAQGGEATNCVSTFTNSDLAVSETDALQYSTTGTVFQFESNRGVQFTVSGNPNGVAITSKTEAINVTQVKVEVASNNTTGMTVTVKVGSTNFTCTTSNDVSQGNSGSSPIILTFTSGTPVTGNVEVALTPKATGKSMYIKSIEVFGGGGSVTPPGPTDSVTLNKPSLSLVVGGSETLEATPGTAGATVTWSSSAPSVATVTNGTVTAVSAGTATIIVTCGTATQTCAVTVTESAQPSLSLNKTSASLIVGGTETLSATPTGGLTGTPSWTSSNTAVARVSTAGVVTAVGEGSATITAQIGEISATCVVTVGHSLTMSTETVVLKVGATHTVTDAVATGTINWFSSNTSVATVTDGTVTAVAEGSATITAMCGSSTLNFLVVVSNEDIPDPETQEVVITFASGFEKKQTGYNLLDWTQSPIAGKAYVYTAQEELQFGKDGGFLLNTVATTGGIVSVKLELSKGEISAWKLLTANTAFTAEAGKVPTGGTEQTDVEINGSTGVWTLDGTHTFFTLNVAASTKISKITITFNKSSINIPAPTDSVTLDKSQLTLDGAGATGKINTVAPTSGTPVWTSSNQSVATVAQNGTVTAVGKGTATITATCGAATATCTVTVNEEDRLTLDKETAQLKVGETLKITATANGEVVWTSTAMGIASVDQEGNVTALAEGTAVIRAQLGSILRTCTITVVKEQETPDPTVTIDKTALTITVGKTETITATATGTVVWTSSNEAVATVANGIVTAVSEGTATITATCGTATATCAVTVEKAQETPPKPNDEVTLSLTSLTLTVSRIKVLIATANGDVVWTSSDEAVATVADGVVTAVSVGTATITATCGTATATCAVTVIADYNTEAFTEAVNQLANCQTGDEKFLAIKTAMEIYSNLDSTQREQVATEYAQLQSAISSYNAAAAPLNWEMNAALETALVSASLWSLAFVAAAWLAKRRTW